MSEDGLDRCFQGLQKGLHYLHQKLAPKLALSHVAMVGCMIVVLLLSLTLAGASAPSLSTVYIMSLAYKNATSLQVDSDPAGKLSTILQSTKAGAQLEVRIGYFGNCFRTPDHHWTCSSHQSVLTQRLGHDSDPLDLVQIASQIQNGVLFTGLVFSSIVLTTVCFLLWATFPGWHTEIDDLDGEAVDVKPFPSKASVNVILTCIILAAMLTLVASVWQHTAAVAVASVIESIGHGSIATSIGATAMALSWTAFGLLCGLSVNIWIVRDTMKILDRLTGD